MGAAHKLKLKAFAKKQKEEEGAGTNVTEGLLSSVKFGAKWGRRASISKKEQLEEERKRLKALKDAKLPSNRRKTEPYNDKDPLCTCDLNSNCHRRCSISQRVCSHRFNKEEMKAKQKVC